MIDEVLTIDARDGIAIGLRVYRPDGGARVPALWIHDYRLDKIGADTIHHSPQHPSRLILPISAI